MTAPPPPPAQAGNRLAVAVDMHRISASVRFDVAARVADVRAVAEFSVDGPEGYPAFDLRQKVLVAELDGVGLGPEGVAHEDLGAGQDAGMRVVDVLCQPGDKHRLVLEYRLGTPQAAGALPLDWADEGDAISWDLWMSDLEPGRYLEMWFPAGLCHDQVAIELEVEVTGTDRPHQLVANGEVVPVRPGTSWVARYPGTYTSFSPMLVLAPADQLGMYQAGLEVAGQAMSLTVASHPGTATPEAVWADAASWLAAFSQRYGRWAHGQRFVAVMWSSPRGMEYDGATTACEAALEHEVFHSWFGRGVKPASANDGWVDEAMATWATASGRASSRRYAVEPLGLDQEPTLLCPPHPWARHTPPEAYPAGSRLLAGVAAMSGGAASLRSALADWHARFGGGQASTADLARHLGSWCGRDLSPWWDRYVYGDQGRPPA